MKEARAYVTNLEVYRSICENVRKYIESLPRDTIVVTAGSPGVESIASEHAKSIGLRVIVHEIGVEDREARMAPYVRNILIVEDSEMITAFTSSWSTLTWHAVGIARDRNKSVHVVAPSTNRS